MGTLEELYKNCKKRYCSRDVDVIAELPAISSKDDKLVFRGVTMDDELFPSILRVEDDQEEMDCERFLRYERALYCEFVKNTIQYLPYYAYPEDLLACGQHYGLKTRLLDWTSNPLVALFFVCNDLKKDSYILSNKIKEDRKLDSLLYVSRSRDYCGEYDERLRVLFENLKCFDEDRPAEQAKLSAIKLEQDGNGERKFDCIMDCKNTTFMLKTHDANQRIVAQQGLFEVCRFYKSCKSIKELKEKRYIEIENSLYTIYKIRSEEKEKIKESLNHLGYNRIRLFPDLASACQYSNEVMREEFFRKSTLQPKNRRQTMQLQL